MTREPTFEAPLTNSETPTAAPPGRPESGFGKDAIALRAALPADCPVLSDLALRSKASWGYDDAFIERCRPVLTVDPDHLRTMVIRLVEQDDRILGFYGLIPDNPAEWEIEFLFVDPAAQALGLGKMLVSHAMTLAAARGAQRLSVISDPYAAPFYRRQGFEPLDFVPSDVDPDRPLPRLVASLDPHLRPGSARSPGVDGSQGGGDAPVR